MSLQVKLNYMGESVLVDMNRVSSTYWEERIKDEIDAILVKYAPIISAEARALLRERILHPEKSTGRLGRSIRWRHNRPGSVSVYGGAPYAGFVEEGTIHFGGHHMILDARIKYDPVIKSEVEIAIKKSMECLEK